jgi:hypothetical protein
MPRINRVQKAATDQGTCGRCNKEIKKGDAYKWIKFRYGGKRKRCGDCQFRGSELTNSDKISRARAAGEDLEDNARSWMESGDADLSELQDFVETFKEDVQEVADEYRESRENMPDTLQDSDVGNQCEENAENLENWVNDAENITLDDFYHDADSDIPKDEQYATWRDEQCELVTDLAGDCPL